MHIKDQIFIVRKYGLQTFSGRPDPVPRLASCRNAGFVDSWEEWLVRMTAAKRLSDMHKRIIGDAVAAGTEDRSWLDVTEAAEVELTSEDADHSIENALRNGGTRGWRAAGPGKQTIRLLFKEAHEIRRIRLEFVENEIERSQEFALHYAEKNETDLHEIRRQQWTFSPQGSISEVEDFAVNLHRVAVLQLTIDPDRGTNRALATLNRWSLA